MLNYHDHVDSGLKKTIETVVDAAFTHLKLDHDAILNVIMIDDVQMQTINQTYAQKNQTTDVLSFPSGLEGEIGDVFISLDQAKRQATDLAHSIEREVGFLCVHGLLHCIGYLHDTEEALAVMTDLQETILEEAKLPRVR